jgi:UPF0755 protein
MEDERWGEGAALADRDADEVEEPLEEAADDWYPRRRWRAWLVSLVVVLLVVAGAAAYLDHWVGQQVDPAKEGKVVNFTVPSGATLSGLAPQLSKRGIISSTLVFRLYLHFEGAKPIHPGTYQLHQHEPYATLLSALARGPVLQHVTIPEGFTLDQIAQRVGHLRGRSAAHFLAVARSGAVRSPYEPKGSKDLEGLVFPDTYSFERSASDKTILVMMVSRFDQEAAAIHLRQVAKQDHMTAYEVVIVASMIEKEAKLPGDRGKVSRVIYNRLNAGMPLQIDATVIYAAGGNPRALQGKDPANVAPDSPYNTYRVRGLPPTPIANPGLASLQAALHPTPGPWLYYVVVAKNGAEAFSSTYAGQQANMALARKRGLPG